MNISITPELNNRKDSAGDQVIQIRCTKDRVHRRISTGLSVHEKFWDKAKHRIKKQHPFADEYNRIIIEKLRKITKVYVELLEQHDAVALDDLVREFSTERLMSFFQFAEDTKLKEIQVRKKMGTYRRYTTALQKFKDFCGTNLSLSKVNYSLLKKYEHYLLEDLGNSRDTVSSNLSVLRAIINEAIRHDLYPGRNPFDQISLKYTDNTKQKLTADELSQFMKTPLPEDIPSLLLARDFFMACFLAEGCRGGDMITMRRDNLNNGCLDYIQHKTGKRMVVGVDPYLQTIIEKYRSESEYLFPLLRSTDKVNEVVINSRLTYVNKYLKEVCKYAGIFKKITTHCARHTFTDLALNVTNGNIYEVQNLLGHNSVRTTEIYTRNRVNHKKPEVINSIMQIILRKS